MHQQVHDYAIFLCVCERFIRSFSAINNKMQTVEKNKEIVQSCDSLIVCVWKGDCVIQDRFMEFDISASKSNKKSYTLRQRRAKLVDTQTSTFIVHIPTCDINVDPISLADWQTCETKRNEMNQIQWVCISYHRAVQCTLNMQTN